MHLIIIFLKVKSQFAAITNAERSVNGQDFDDLEVAEERRLFRLPADAMAVEGE